MESRKAGLVVAAVGVIAAVVLFIVLSGGSDEEPEPAGTGGEPVATAPQEGRDRERAGEPAKPEPPPVPTIEIRDGEPVGGVQEIEFESGESARLLVDADEPDELHFHGYDLYVDVGPGKPAEVTFEADIEGVFEVESHSTGVIFANVSVVPD